MGIKREVSAYKKRMRIVCTVVALLIIICVAIVASVYFGGLFAGSVAKTGTTGGNLVRSVNGSVLRAALIDPLSATDADVGFTSSVNETLRKAGYTLDVYKGNQVTVDFLERFPGGYKLVILRMHSGISSSRELYFFTAESYSSGKYSQEQYFGLVKEAYATESSQPVFAVNWGFVERLMTGAFNGTLVLAMGCDAASDPLITSEFFNQGAVGYVGWNGSVLLSHSDEAVLQLVEDMYAGGQQLKEAVNDTNSQIGPDPASGSILECYVP